MKTSQKISYNHSPAVLGASLVAGLGLVLVILALGFGVVQTPGSDSSGIGLVFLIGVALFILGTIAWFVMTQPQRHFDDINVAAPDEHGHGHEHDVSEHDDAQHAHSIH